MMKDAPISLLDDPNNWIPSKIESYTNIFLKKHLNNKIELDVLEQNVFNNAFLSFDDNKVLKVQLDMLIFFQVCRTIN